MRVWLDQDLCSGCGCCEEAVPEVFELGKVDGVSHVKEDGQVLGYDGAEGIAEVPAGLEPRVRKAAENCPAEIIYCQ